MSTRTNASLEICGWPSVGSEFRFTRGVRRPRFKDSPMKREWTELVILWYASEGCSKSGEIDSLLSEQRRQ